VFEILHGKSVSSNAGKELYKGTKKQGNNNSTKKQYQLTRARPTAIASSAIGP